MFFDRFLNEVPRPRGLYPEIGDISRKTESLSPKGREAQTFAVPPLLVSSTISRVQSLSGAIPWALITLPLRRSLLGTIAGETFSSQLPGPFGLRAGVSFHHS